MSHDTVLFNTYLWSQNDVLNGSTGNGPWAVTVVESGTYEIELCRWPREADTAITEAPEDGGAAIIIHSVSLSIQKKEYRAPVNEGDKGVTFTVDLKKGDAFLQTWLHSDDQNVRPAYYVYVRKVL